MSCWCFIVNCIECFYVNDEPQSKFLYIETIKMYCIVSKCVLSVMAWLWWAKPHNNGTDKPAKAGQSAERGNASHTGDHQGHTHWHHAVLARPPTSANQTESGAGHAYSSAIENPITQPMKPWKTSRGLNTASMPADRAQANQAKVSKPIPASLRDSIHNTGESTIETGQQRSNFSLSKALWVSESAL